ncbi:hypothetical protein [Methyloversatilis universalis]|uniref:hypothetical protein n=1 Tax=Methyloversatilis universalis TaxID=378211 RepID=UPI00037C937F|nr:hypothetical protein [Methyloversatilis universalis]
MKIPFQLISVRHVQGKKDTSKTYSIIGGIVTLEGGLQGFAELFAEGKHVYQPGVYQVELKTSIDMNRRLELRFEALHPANVKPAHAA